MSSPLCFICNNPSQGLLRNFDQIKAKYSGYPLVTFMKNFYRNFKPRRSIIDPSNYICKICLDQVNEYDNLRVKAKQIEDKLHKLLVRSDKCWHDKNKDNINKESTKEDNKEDIDEGDIKGDDIDGQTNVSDVEMVLHETIIIDDDQSEDDTSLVFIIFESYKIFFLIIITFSIT